MTQKESIFIIEDDPEIRRLVDTILSKNGYVVTSADTAEKALKRIPGFKPSLIVLDFELPGINGIECCKRIRTNPAIKSTPIILLSVHGSEVYKITALEAGADDFVTKPFSHGELLARVRAVLRRGTKKEFSKNNAVVKEGPFQLDHDSHAVSLGDKSLELAPKEFAILDLLINSKGKIISRDVLSTQVWERENLPTSRTIDVHVARLRKKLGAHKLFIQTVGKLGYRYLKPEP